MCQFIETIRIDSGEARNLTYHEQRLNDTRNHFWPGSHALQLADFLPPVPESGIHKLRIVYGQDGIEDVTCTPYLLRPVRSLALIQADEIGYTYKSTDRQVLDRLFAQRGSCDDILIVRPPDTGGRGDQAVKTSGQRRLHDQFHAPSVGEGAGEGAQGLGICK